MSSVISFVISLCLILQIWKNVLSKFKLNESKHGLNYIYMTMAWSNPGSSDERESQPQTCSLSFRRLAWARQATTLLLSHTCYILKTHMTLYLLGHVCSRSGRHILYEKIFGTVYDKDSTLNHSIRLQVYGNLEFQTPTPVASIYLY